MSFKHKIRNVIEFLNENDGTLKKKIFRSGFWISVSSIVANILTFLRFIVLARLLTPEIFGLMGICMIIIRGMELFSQTGFSAALIQRQKQFKEAKDTAYTLLILRGIILALITFVVAPIVANYYEKQVLDLLIKVIAISFIFDGFYNINTIACERDLDFKRLAYLQQTTALVNTIVAISLAYLFRNVWALVIGNIAASFVGVMLSYIMIPGKPRICFNKEIAKELLKYGKFITGITIVLFVATEIDKAIIGKLLGVEALGYYVIAYMLANLPATHISKLISRIMLPVYSKLQNDIKALRETYLKVLRIIASISAHAAVGIATLAPEIIGLLYGEKWMPAVGALRILCVFGGLRAIVSINGYLCNGIGKPYIPFYFGVIRLLIVVILIYPLTVRYGLLGASTAVTAPLILEIILGLYILTRVISLNLLKAIRILLVAICTSAIMSIVIFYCKNNILSVSISSLFLLVILGMVIFVLLNFKFLYNLYKKAVS